MSSSSASSVISHYKRKMERHPKESDVLLHCLSKLDRVEVNIAILQETGIGRVVNSLKKSDQEDVSEKARLLVAKWKDVVAKEDNEGDEEASAAATTTTMSSSSSLPHEEQDSDDEEEQNSDENGDEEDDEKPPTPSPPPSPPHRSSSHHKKHHKKKKSSHRDSEHRKSTSSSSQSHGSSKRQKNETLKASDSFGNALMNSSNSSSSSSSKKKKSSKEDRSESSSHKRTHSESSTSKRSHSAESSSSSHKKSHSEMSSSSSSKKSSSSHHLEPSSKKSSQCSESSRSKKSSDNTESVSIPSSDLLPTISPNYRPLPPKKESNNGVKRFQNDDEALSSLISMSKSSKRTAVFSGVKKSGYVGPVPSLMEMCITVLQEHVDYIYECGGLDFITLKPILERASPQTLAQIEEHNQYLMTETGDLWERFCKKNFPKEKRQEMESWREMFERCTVEREEKLNFLKVKVKDSYKKVESSYRQTKLAYVGTVAKPPRSVFRAQAKNGTAIPYGNPLKRPMANSGAGTSSSSSSKSSSSISSSAAPKKPKMAPLMSKTLKMARGIKGGFRR